MHNVYSDGGRQMLDKRLNVYKQNAINIYFYTFFNLVLKKQFNCEIHFPIITAFFKN